MCTALPVSGSWNLVVAVATNFAVTFLGPCWVINVVDDDCCTVAWSDKVVPLMNALDCLAK
jgi:hypothetical protein